MARTKKSTFERLKSGPLNRQQRRELARRLKAEDPGLEVVNRNVAGIDVGNESHFVAVAPSRDTQPVREFGSWTADLQRMAEWLKACQVETVVMQSTGVYWIALYDVLEAWGLKVCLVNARDTKNLPGRKTDVQESQWLLKLHTYGLLRDSFRPPEEIRALRSLWRLRDRHGKEAARTVQHMQKSMISMNLQLSNALSDISGVSGQAIIRAILKGERDAWKLAKLHDKTRKGQRRGGGTQPGGELAGGYAVRTPTGHRGLRFHPGTNRGMRSAAKQATGRFTGAGSLNGCDSAAAVTVITRPRRKKAKNAPRLDLQIELARICGVDLTSIDGIDVLTAQTLVAELGTDYSRWKDEAHFASWLGLSPSRKVVKQPSRKVKNRVATALRTAAQTLLRSDSYLGARYRSLRTRLGAPKAIKAMARYLACLVFRLFIHGQAWVDRGAAQFEDRRQQGELVALEYKAAANGFKLVSLSDPT